MNKTKKEYQLKKIKRGIELLVYGIIISILTKFEFGDSYVKFGIFHFMGTATILSSFYSNLPIISVIISFSIILLHSILSIPNIKYKFFNICNKNPFTCFILGILNVKYSSIDHFSIIPFLGYFSLGIVISYILYNRYKNKKNEYEIKRQYSFMNYIDNYKDNIFVKLISWLGKNTIPIYFIHFIIFYIFFKMV